MMADWFYPMDVIKRKQWFNLVVSLPLVLGLSSVHAWTVIQPYVMDYFVAGSVAASVPFYSFTVFFSVGFDSVWRPPKAFSISFASGFFQRYHYSLFSGGLSSAAV